MTELSVALVTPTFAGDLARAELLVESLERSGTQLPLVLVVHTEDAPLFRRLQNRLVTVLTTADVLPPALERRRRSGYRRRDPRRYVTGRPVHGWATQQVVKLRAASVLGVDVVGCVDSDVVLLRPLEPMHFITPDRAPRLFHSPDDNALSLSWAVDSLRFFDVPLESARLRQYVHQCVALHRATCERLMARIEQQRRRHPWWRTMLDLHLMEYPMHGVFAEHVDHASPLHLSPPLNVSTYWSNQPGVDVLQDLPERIRQEDPLAVCIQSRLGYHPDEYRGIIEPLWP